MIGQMLGPYRVLEKLGVGGMGEVYKALDTRLDRTVAIKVLPAHVSADPERRARFEREAKTIAGLTHPHICTLYDVGSTSSPQGASEPPVLYLVMEHLQGETLAERLTKGPLSLEQTLAVATEIADALAAAHRQGVIHRDLKPGNVMLTKAGAARHGSPQAKLLDFGLAKLRGHGEQPAAAQLMSAPTQSTPLTGEGVILGTLQYMAPEQLEGKPADARTDLWALGAIVYEMVAGKHAFEGTSAASLITAIMGAEPPALVTLQPLTPPSVDRLVRRCLAKDPDARWDTAHDVAEELRWLRETSGVATPTAAQPRRRWRMRLAWGVALTAALLAVVSTTLAILLWTRSSLPSIAAAPVRFLLSDQRPAETLMGTQPGAQPSFAVSRDGQRVAFVVERDGVRRLYLRDLQTLGLKEIPGTENAIAPFFSPDGQRVGFFADFRLKRVALAGGAPVVLADVGTNPRGAAWASDDLIVFNPDGIGGLWKVPAAGSVSPQLLAEPDPTKKERNYRWPSVLPDGDAIVFTVATSDTASFDDGRLVVRSLRTGEQRELLRGGSFATYAATGHLLYACAGSLMAVPFDVARQRVTGKVTSVLEGLVTYPSTGAAQYAVADDGTLVYIAGQAVSRQSTLTWIDRTGRASPVGAPPGAFTYVSIAPSGREAALQIDAANSNIWLLDFERPTSPTRLTTEWSNHRPFWSPDGSRVGFLSARAGASQVFWQGGHDESPAEPLTPRRPAPASEASFARDGTLIFSELAQGTGWDLWTLATGGNRSPEAFLQTRANERMPRFSPDGRLVAYESDETGKVEVWVREYPRGEKKRISADGGSFPVWARDGRELFYRNGDDMMGVTIRTSPSISAGRPQLLFRRESPYQFDVVRDGRFLMIADLAPPVLGPLTVVLNWQAELRRRSAAAQ